MQALQQGSVTLGKGGWFPPKFPDNDTLVDDNGQLLDCHLLNRSVVLGMGDGSMTTLTIADPEKPGIAEFLKDLPSRFNYNIYNLLELLHECSKTNYILDPTKSIKCHHAGTQKMRGVRTVLAWPTFKMELRYNTVWASLLSLVKMYIWPQPFVSIRLLIQRLFLNQQPQRHKIFPKLN